jgi:hypothetical protein
MWTLVIEEQLLYYCMDTVLVEQYFGEHWSRREAIAKQCGSEADIENTIIVISEPIL